MKRFLTLLAFMVATICSYAYDCEVDGIYYNLSGNEATVTCKNGFSLGGYSASEIVIPEEITYNGTTYSVTSIGRAFYGCTSLTSVTIPNSVKKIGDYAFCNCDALASVKIPSSVTSIGSNAFYGCRKLISIEIPNSVMKIGNYAFSLCLALTTIMVEEGNMYYSSMDNVLFDKDKTKLICCAGAKSGEVIIPNSVTSIGSYAFYYCSGLASVTIPNSVTSIGISAFSGCSSLTSVNIPNSVTSIGESAFSGCTSLPVVNNIRYADTYLVGVVDKTCISANIKVGTRIIGRNAFFGCTNLASITIPNSVTSIEYGSFQNCSSLTSVNIPNSVTSIGESAFSGCTSLPVVNNIRYADTYLVELVDKSCTSVNIKVGTRIIGNKAFYNCSDLTSVEIPNSVTSIENQAFAFCSSLTSVTLGNSVKSIVDYAFMRCTNIKTVYCYADDVPSIGLDTFNGVPYDSVTLYVPSGSIDAYKTYPWIWFGTILPIPEPENNLKIESVYADKNSEDITLSIGLDNETQFTSVMFDLYLPEGVTALKDDLGYYMDLNNTRCNSRGGFTLEGEEQADGAVRVMLYSSRGTMISGDSGELLTITLKTTGDIAAGNHKFEVKRVICAVDVTAEGRYELKNADGYVRVKGVEEISLTVPEGGYATLCLPYAASLPTGLKAYKATGVNDDKVVVEEQQNIPACTPLIIMGTPGNYSFSGNNSAATQFEYNVGSLKASLILAESSEGYVLQDLSEGLGFYKISRKLTVPANRCVLDEAAASAAPAFVPVSFDEDANAIEATGYKLQTTDSSVYTIDGKRVKTMEKGKIYIVNGVKMMVK